MILITLVFAFLHLPGQPNTIVKETPNTMTFYQCVHRRTFTGSDNELVQEYYTDKKSMKFYQSRCYGA